MSFYIYLFYNFDVRSTCFKRSSHSSSGVYRGVLYYTALYNCANVSSCFDLTLGTNTRKLPALLFWCCADSLKLVHLSLNSFKMEKT